MDWRGIARVLRVLGIAAAHAGAAQATGAGFGADTRLSEVYHSLDGQLEFSEFRFRDIDPDQVTIEIGESDITFSGEASVTGFAFDTFSISYTVRTVTDEEIIGSALRLDSQVNARNGAVVATQEIAAPREAKKALPWPSLQSWQDDDDRDHPGEGKSGREWKDEDEHSSRQIGTLIAFNIASGWVCGCGHHHASLDDVESECRIERPSDRIGYEGETTLHILNSVKLLSLGTGGVSWQSIANSYVVTPEPGSAGLLGLGLVGLIVCGRRRG